VAVEQLYADFFAEFGVEAPVPITAEPIPASNVDRPAAGDIDEGGVDPDVVPPDDAAPGRPGAADGGSDVAFVIGLVAALAAALAVAFVMLRGARDSHG
jgi:hypothetical protein